RLRAHLPERPGRAAPAAARSGREEPDDVFRMENLGHHGGHLRGRPNRDVDDEGDDHGVHDGRHTKCAADSLLRILEEETNLGRRIDANVSHPAKSWIYFAP